MSAIQQKFFSEEIPQNIKIEVENARKELFDEAPNLNLLLSSETDQDIEHIKDVAKKITQFQNLIIIGTGASESIPRMFYDIGNPRISIKFLSTLDEYTISKLTENVDFKNTAFLIISKSGITIEVLALTLFFIKKIKTQIPGNKIGNHFHFITSPNTPLHNIAKDMNASIIKHANIGGRFASFSALGFLSAAISGMDLDAIIENAKNSFLNLIKPNSWVIQAAEYNYFMSSKFSSNIFMYYHDSLNGLSLWTRQIIAESLGKDGKGFNCVLSNGVLDHHSQLQLYLDGPNDKFFTVIYKNEHKKDFFITENEAKKYHINISPEKSLSDIHSSQINAAIESLIEQKKNIRTINIIGTKEEFISEFIMGMMLEVMLFAYLININPFGQPAVELMKKKLNIGRE